jgi:surfeit locus 1 family protein
LLQETAEEGSSRWPRVIERVEPAQVSERHGREMMPDLLLPDASEPDRYLREWAPPGTGPERHIGYAVQWFALAALLLVRYLRHHLHRNRGDGTGRRGIMRQKAAE